MFKLKDNFYFAAIVLLGLNAVFLYFNWMNRSSTSVDAALAQDILMTSEVELKSVLEGHRIPSATTKEKPTSVFVFVREQHCDLCKQEARPYWKSMAEFGNVDFKLYYHSRQPRGWERFALWMELPKEHIIPVSSIANEDTLFWSSSAPSVIVINNNTKEIKLAHAGSSHLRKRSILFYEFLIEYLTKNGFTRKS